MPGQGPTRGRGRGKGEGVSRGTVLYGRKTSLRGGTSKLWRQFNGKKEELKGKKKSPDTEKPNREEFSVIIGACLGGSGERGGFMEGERSLP